jgi:predicted AAA+ superfamily ATPase
LVFDEIHRYRGWRNYLKGFVDLKGRSVQVLVTGSARLDLFRFGGDTLQGRYFFHRFHPLSVAELGISSEKDFRQLLTLGGFPEPFLSGSEADAKRWARNYRSRLLEEEISSIERIHDLGKMELLAIRLPDLVGSPLSINSLREDLEVSHPTLSRWVRVLEAFYAIVRLPPFGAPRIRAVKKEAKHYHFDWSVVDRPEARFENMVALHLLKWVHGEQDGKGRDVELRYFRDIDGREVDFIVTEKRKPILLVEAKWGDAPVDSSLKYLKARFPDCPAWQISATGKKDYRGADGIRVAHALTFLKDLI